MNDVNYELSIGTNWSLDMFITGHFIVEWLWSAHFTNWFQHVSLPNNAPRLIHFHEGFSDFFFPLFFNYFYFTKHLNNTTGVMLTRNNGWWGSYSCIVRGSSHQGHWTVFLWNIGIEPSGEKILKHFTNHDMRVCIQLINATWGSSCTSWWIRLH